MTDDAGAGDPERGIMGGWVAAVEADPRYARFSIAEAEATFAAAGFARVPKEDFAWGDTLSGTDWPCACFDRNGVWVAAHRLGCSVFAPGDGNPMASFPDAGLAIRFVWVLERDAELMAADGFSDEQFYRVQAMAAAVTGQALEEAEGTVRRLRDWMGLDGEGVDAPGSDPAQAAGGERAPAGP
jgi:hypothetical protein